MHRKGKDNGDDDFSKTVVNVCAHLEPIDTLLENPVFISHLQRICRSLAPNWTDADDLFNDVCMKVVQKIDQFDPSIENASFVGWLRRVAHNLNMDRMRRKSLELDDTPSNERYDLRDPGADPYQQLWQRELTKKLNELIAKQEESERLILTHYFQGRSFREIEKIIKAEHGIHITHVTARTIVRNLLRVFFDLRLSPPALAELVPVIEPVIEKIRQLEPSLIAHLQQHNEDLNKIHPTLFEHLFAEFLAARGFDDVRLVGRNVKTSADIFAAKFIPGIDIPMRVFVEVKRWKDMIGIEVINQVLGAFLGERERFGWNAALIVTVGGFRDFEKWSREELALKGLYLKDRDDLLRYLDGYKQHANGLWLPNPRTDL